MLGEEGERWARNGKGQGTTRGDWHACAKRRGPQGGKRHEERKKATLVDDSVDADPGW